MSCSLTIDAVRDRSKTVTRRAKHTWTNLRPGDPLTLIEKGMGLKRGERQVILAEVEVVDVRLVNLARDMTAAECAAEGFPDLTPAEFVEMWCVSHHISRAREIEAVTDSRPIVVRRIEWRYLP